MREYKELTIHRSRDWLNPEESSDTGAMSIKVEANSHSVDAYLVIRDCSRQIELDFCFTPGDAPLEKERLTKISTMISRLKEMEKALKTASKVCKKLQKEYRGE